MINPMTRSSPIRMMGLASGMDTDFIIQQTMRMHQFRIDQKIRQRTTIEWRQQIHNDIRQQLQSFSSSLLSMTSPRSMFASNTYNTHVSNLARAEGKGGSTSAVSIRTSTSSQLGSFKILSVNSLTKGASLTSANRISAGGVGFNPNSTTLEGLNFASGPGFVFEPGTYNATLNLGDNRTATINQEAARTALSGAGVQDKLTVGSGDTALELTRTGSGTESSPFKYYHKGAELTFDSEGKWGITFESGEDEVTYNLTRNENGSIAVNGTTRSFIRETEIDAVDSDGKDIKITLSQMAGSDTRLAVEDAVIWGIEKDSATQPNTALTFTSTHEITINGKEITLSSNMTINDMIRKINSSEANVTMSYNQITDMFTLESNAVGDDSPLWVEGLEMLGIGRKETGTVVTEVGSYKPGSFAEVWVSTGTGDPIKFTSTTGNTISAMGVTITLNEVFNKVERLPSYSDEDYLAEIKAAGANDFINVNISRNVDDAFNNIKSFIDSYNTIIGRLENLLRERKTDREKSYQPLTDEEKANMTDRQIEQWEEIAKKGILRNDIALKRLARDLRNSFFQEIEGMGVTPSSLGLSTGNFFDRTGGQIFIDEDRLRAALEEDPDRVMSIFTRNGQNMPFAEQGLVARINTTINRFISTTGTQNNTLRSLEQSIRHANQQIERMQTRMFAEEERLYRQFAAMETALSKTQQQGDWFASMLGTNNK